MSRLFRRIYHLLVLFGIDPRRTIRSLLALPSYFHDFRSLAAQRAHSVRDFPFGKPYPCLDDRTQDSGYASGHYFHQDLLVARRVHSNNPANHVDVGSRIDGLVAHVASFRAIDVLDIRPLSSTIPNVRFIQMDLTMPLPPEMVGISDSLSCLHAIEHFGLGRYGDPVNYDGYIVGLDNLHLLLTKGGKLYFSVPIGPQRIEFNAHRVFSLSYLLECFDGKYRLDRFSYVDDLGDLHEDQQITDAARLESFGCNYGCGIFEMTKL